MNSQKCALFFFVVIRDYIHVLYYMYFYLHEQSPDKSTHLYNSDVSLYLYRPHCCSQLLLGCPGQDL